VERKNIYLLIRIILGVVTFTAAIIAIKNEFFTHIDSNIELSDEKNKSKLYNKTKENVVSNISSDSTSIDKTVKNAISKNKDSIILKNDNKNEVEAENEIIRNKNLKWPINKQNSTSDYPQIFYVQRANNVYNWKILNTKNLKTETIHKTKFEPSNFLFDKVDDRLYFVMNGKLFYCQWPNFSSILKVEELPYRRVDGTNRYRETELWQDSFTGLFRIAIMGTAEKTSDSTIVFNENEYDIYKDVNGSKYCNVRANRWENAEITKVFFTDSKYPEIIEIYEYNWQHEWHLITGAPTTSEACDTPGFKKLDFLINSHAITSYPFHLLRLDSQCSKPNECFDHTETNALKETLSEELRQNKRFGEPPYRDAIGNIKINDTHELYFPIIRSDTYNTHQSNPVILSADLLQKKIPLSLSWDSKTKLKDNILISTATNFLLIQNEYDLRSRDGLGLLFNSNNDDGKPIFKIKGSYITFLPKYMVSLMKENL
jgi:hypothetical protein